MGVSSQDNWTSNTQSPPSAGPQLGFAVLSPSPQSRTCPPCNSKQPSPFLTLPGCLTLCYVPERSEIMREDPLAPGPSPANLT